MKDDETTYCYVGIMPGCGCAGMVTVDDEKYVKDTAKFVASGIRDGLEMRRMTVVEFRQLPQFGCAQKLKMKECRKRGLNVAQPTPTEGAPE